MNVSYLRVVLAAHYKLNLPLPTSCELFLLPQKYEMEVLVLQQSRACLKHCKHLYLPAEQWL